MSNTGNIPKDWKKVKLGEICTDISYGYTASAKLDSISPKFLRITDIVPNRIDWETVPYCKIDDKNIEKYKLEVGDIVIARTGATTGYNKVIKNNIESVFASYLIRYKINKEIANPFFVGYNLQSYIWNGFVKNIIGGSAQPGANAKQFSSYEFLLPPLPEQKAIAKILSSLDDKIELLQKQNKTLEAIGQAIFKHWFVDFEFPDEEGKPYKSSGGKMVYNEELEKEIPKGWEVGRFEDIASDKKNAIVDGPFGTQLHSAEYKSEGIPVIRIINLSFDGRFIGNDLVFIDEEKFNELKRSVTYPGDILLAKTGATIGKFSILPFYIDKAIVASSVLKITPKNNRYYLYNVIKNFSKQDYWARISAGSTRSTINLDDVKKIEIIIPPQKIVEKYELLMEKFYSLIETTEVQNLTLSQIRNSLLPKLMSGKIRVPLEKKDND